MKYKIIEELTNKKVLILGFGREGKSTYRFIKENGVKCELAIADRNDIDKNDVDNRTKLYIGEDYMNSILKYDIVIKSPGISFKGKDYSKFESRITSQTELFLKYARNKVVGITGTKVKSTTSSLIYQMVKEKYNARLVGNIGKPVFEEIDNYDNTDIFVYELSSHQLEHIKYSPHIAVLLNMFEEHLDHYNSYNEYKEAKRNIFKYQRENDIYVFNGDAKKLLNKEYNLKQRQLPVCKQYNDCVEGTIYSEKNICVKINNKEESINIPQNANILGKHNIFNLAVATTVAKVLNVGNEDVIKAIKEFKMLPHRLEKIGEYNQVIYIDDSISTIPEATMSAVDSIENIDTVLIGGLDRGIDYSKLVKYIEGDNIHNVILMYESGKKIYDLVDHKKATSNIIYVKDLNEAVKQAVKITEKGKICLLSPAAASYGMFKNFEDRGDKFKQLVIKYSK